MNKNVLKAKINRNNFREYSGEYFVDEDSDLIKHLNKNGFKAVVGVSKDNDVFTIICENFVCYSNNSNEINKLSFSEFSSLLSNETMKYGKEYEYHTIKGLNDNFIWIKDKLTMNSLWNIILWLEKVNE